MIRFQGSGSHVATGELALAVNAAIARGRPLLIKGEPGTGKTRLAQEVARALDKPLFEWHIKSTSKSQHGLYEYDAVSRLRDSQLGDARVQDIANYIMPGMLWRAFECERQAVLLIDEIEKADIEFPNDLLRELDRMEFYVYETQTLVRARHRPVGSSRCTTLGLKKALLAEDIPPEALRAEDQKTSIPPLYGALLKNEQDVDLSEQRVFLNRRAGRPG